MGKEKEKEKEKVWVGYHEPFSFLNALAFLP